MTINSDWDAMDTASSKLYRLNNAANTVQRYKDGARTRAKMTINWFLKGRLLKSN